MTTYIVCKKDDKYYKQDFTQIIKLNSKKFLKFEDETDETIKTINEYLKDKKFIKTDGDDNTHMTYYIYKEKENTLLLTIRKIIKHDNNDLLYIIEYEKDDLKFILTEIEDIRSIYQQFGIEKVLI